MNTYANLINRKLIVPSQKTSYLAVDMHYFSRAHGALVKQIAFDEGYYLSRYPDIGDAIKAGTIASALDHYVAIGYYENRMPYEILIDEEWYLNEYPDIRRAVANQDFASGQNHFDDQGYAEGRLPFAHFKLKTIAA